MQSGIAVPDEAEVGRLLEALEADDGSAREKAQASLEEMALSVERRVRGVREVAKAGESRERLSLLLAEVDSPVVHASGSVQRLRAVWALEGAGAREVLEAIAGPRASTRLEREARAAADRLQRAGSR